MKNKKLICFFVLLFFCFLIFSANFCLAQSLLEDSSQVKYEGSLEKGDFTLNDFVRVGMRVTEIILGIVGSLALLMFIYGGLMMIIAGVSTRAEGGKDKKINIGKDAIENAIIGLVIVFAAYMIIGFVFSAFDIPDGKNWASSNWFKTNK